jgi:hypothetical protein
MLSAACAGRHVTADAVEADRRRPTDDRWTTTADRPTTDDGDRR